MNVDKNDISEKYLKIQLKTTVKIILTKHFVIADETWVHEFAIQAS